MFAEIASLIRDVICFIPFVLILPIFSGIDGILYAAPAADAIAMLVTAALTVVFFKSLNRQTEIASSND